MKVIIGTKNEAKYSDFRLYLGDEYEVLKGSLSVHIAEGMHSLEENAITKARTWSTLTDEVALADDTGFFIEALNGEPGVSSHRWGGELPDDASNEACWNLLQDKMAGHENMNAYFEQCVAVVSPNGKLQVVYNRTVGYLDKEKLLKPYNGTGYPLAAAFVTTGRAKTWDEMSDREKLVFEHSFIIDLKNALRAVT